MRCVFKRMVCHDDPYPVLRVLHKYISNSRQRAASDPTALDTQRIHRVDSDHEDLVVNKDRLKVLIDPSSISTKRRQKTSEDIVQGNVVISRHHQDFGSKGIDKRPGLLELRSAGALGQVARYHNQIRRQLVHKIGQRFHQFRAIAPEMQVGQVNDTFNLVQVIWFGSSDPGRLRRWHQQSEGILQDLDLEGSGHALPLSIPGNMTG